MPFVLAQNIPSALANFHSRRLIRPAAVQGISLASDIIIRGFDTPAKVTFKDGIIQFENFNYAGVVTQGYCIPYFLCSSTYNQLTV